jgi:hypothetical protein
MNVHGMSRAASLRRTALGNVDPHVFSVRVRPDDRAHRHAALWDCIASLAPLVNNRSAANLTLSDRLKVLGRARKAPGKELRERSRELLWLAISSCGQGGLTAVANDNCILAPSMVLDDVLGQFDLQSGYQRIYARATAMKLSHSRPELQLAIAAKFAGVGLSNACDNKFA